MFHSDSIGFYIGSAIHPWVGRSQMGNPKLGGLLNQAQAAWTLRKRASR